MEIGGGVSGSVTRGGLDAEAQRELDEAVRALEGGRGVVLGVAEFAGRAIFRVGRSGLAALRLAVSGDGQLGALAEAALERAYDVAILGMEGPASGSAPLARATVLVSGAVGGALGVAGFLPDATVTTLAIMREIARIAREEGEDIADEATRHACLEVFGLAGKGGESGYWETRLMLGSAPAMRMLATVAARYGVVLGEKLSLQAVPLLGAVTAAALNAAFLDHYRRVARAHFTIRRLERAHGREVVRRAMPVSNRSVDEPFVSA